jgi:chromosome segregation ATPase
VSDDNSFKGRVTRQGEEAIGKLAQDLLENPAVSRALSAAFETRERAMRAQEVAMGALNLPSASDLERLTRRVRSVSQRLEGIEDGLDRLDERLGRVNSTDALNERLAKIEATLERLEQAGAARPAPTAPARTRPTPARSSPPRPAAGTKAGARPPATKRSTTARPVPPESEDYSL